MDRCPCCNARLREQSVCSRCKTELSDLIDSEQSAKDWLSMSMSFWAEGNVKQSVMALDYSLALHQTKIAQSFRDFMIHKSCQEALDLLATKQYVIAKQNMCQVNHLLPYSDSLQKINSFADSLYFSLLND